MRKGVKIIFWGLGIIIALLIALVIVGPIIYLRMAAPDHEFGTKPLPLAPDYSLRAHWAAWPDESSPAGRLPEGVERIPREERLASAFFLHPTTYGGKEHWVQPMDDEATNLDTDNTTISRQASAFNGCCRVYAPRYRQSNLVGDHEQEVTDRIITTGYDDVRAAFLHFLDEIGPAEPFVLGSHSQGTEQMVRLLMEEVDGTPVMDRLVAAYAIGNSLTDSVLNEGFTEIDVCHSPTQTGCFITWDAHEGDKSPSMWSEGGEQTIWNGRDYTGFTPGTRICVNPITWRTDTRPSGKEDHFGALKMWAGDTGLDTSLGELIANTVSVHCGGEERNNWLFVNSDRDPRLKSKGIWALVGRNLHGSDYSLFWANIRRNARDRVRAFVEARSPATD